MTKVLLGDYGVFLSAKGIVKLHELKYEESYFYKLDENSVLTHISRKKFLKKCETMSTNGSIYLLTHVCVPNGTEWDSLDNKTLLKMWFYADWVSVGEDQREDIHLIELFESNDKSFFSPIGDKWGSYKVVDIPNDVKEWSIHQDDIYGDEWVQEKARTWK